MTAEWIAITDREPGCERVLVTRHVPDGNRYVDVVVWVPEPASGLRPWPSKLHVTHWMPLPKPPEMTK